MENAETVSELFAKEQQLISHSKVRELGLVPLPESVQAFLRAEYICHLEAILADQSLDDGEATPA